MSAAEGGREGGIGDRSATARGAVRPRLTLGQHLARARDGISEWLSRQVDIEAGERTGFFMIPAALMLGIGAYFSGPTPSSLCLLALFTVMLLLGVAWQDGLPQKPLS